MRTIIAGSRSGARPEHLSRALGICGWQPTTVLNGGAAGADALGHAWALRNNIPVEHFPADWAKHGRGAGAIRNEQMAQNAEALIALWDGKSPGTRHMIKLAHEYGLKLHIEDITK